MVQSIPPLFLILFGYVNNQEPKIASNLVFATDIHTLSEAWSGVNWSDIMAAQGAFGTDLYDRSTRTISRHDALDGV